MLKESDLYEPIKAFFIENEYDVKGEVKNIDMLVTKEDETIAIELKPTFNLKLILQAVDRQKMFDTVYVAIFKPKSINKRYKEMVHLLKRLELGLITVSLLKSGTRVTVEHHPIVLERRKNHRKKNAIIKEAKARTGVVDNLGGTTKVKRMTAYREASIACAVALKYLGQTAPKDVKKLVSVEKASAILYQNFYGWFERIDKGVYQINNKGLMAIEEYKEVSDYFDKICLERNINETE